jgi:hypothetical protein
MIKPPSSGTDHGAPSPLEVKPEVMNDLDVTGDDAKDIVGGGCSCFGETRMD